MIKFSESSLARRRLGLGELRSVQCPARADSARPRCCGPVRITDETRIGSVPDPCMSVAVVSLRHCHSRHESCLLSVVGPGRGTMSVHDVHAVRLKLESYARTKVASILQPMTENMLVEQPVDPVAFMIRSLISAHFCAILKSYLLLLRLDISCPIEATCEPLSEKKFSRFLAYKLEASVLCLYKGRVCFTRFSTNRVPAQCRIRTIRCLNKFPNCVPRSRTLTSSSVKRQNTSPKRSRTSRLVSRLW